MTAAYQKSVNEDGGVSDLFSPGLKLTSQTFIAIKQDNIEEKELRRENSALTLSISKKTIDQ